MLYNGHSCHGGGAALNRLREQLLAQSRERKPKRGNPTF